MTQRIWNHREAFCNTREPSDFPVFTKYMNSLKVETVQMSPEADKEMRAVAEKVMGQRIGNQPHW